MENRYMKKSGMRYKTENNPGEAIYPRTQKHYHYSVARYSISSQGKKYVFEVDIDPQRALELRHGKDIDIRDVLKVQRVFTDVSAARFAKNNDLQKLFGTHDPLEVAVIIIKKGKIQPSLEEERRLRAEKKERITNALLKCAVRAKTKEHLTSEDVEKMLARTKIDLHEPDSWILRRVIEHAPVTCAVHSVQITLAPQHVGRARYHLAQLTKIRKEETLPDGRWQVSVDVPIGIKEEVFAYLNGLTHGKFENKLISG